MEIEGRIIQKLALQEGVSKAGNPWKKQEYVLETQGNYPRKVKFDFFGERADRHQLEIGKVYTISYDLESREFNGRWYTDVRAYDCREAGAAQAPVQQPAQQPAFGNAPAADPFAAAPAPGGDDLPF